MKCQMTSKKLLKLINMYEINESVCQVLHEEIQKIHFFSAGFSCHLRSNKIYGLNHGSAAQSPGKASFPQKEIVMSQRWISPTAALAGLMLSQLYHSCGLWATAEGGAPVKDPDYILQVPGVCVALLEQ